VARSKSPNIQELDPTSVEFLAHHVVLRRMMVRGKHCAVENALPIPKLQQIATDLLASGFEAAGHVAAKYDLIPNVTSVTGFYRWRTRVFEMALAVQREIMAARMLPQLARLDEVAEALRLPVAKTRKLAEAGELPLVEIAPGEHRVPTDAVADLIAARSVKRPGDDRSPKAD